MSAIILPAGHQTVMPYLFVNGALKFSDFLQTVFGGTESQKRMRDDYHVMHAEVQIGTTSILFSDANNDWPPTLNSLFIYVENTDVTYQKALENGCVSIMVPADQDYGRSAGIKDSFGFIWWITTPRPL